MPPKTPSVARCPTCSVNAASGGHGLNAAGLTSGPVLQRLSTEQPDTVISRWRAAPVVTCGSRLTSRSPPAGGPPLCRCARDRHRAGAAVTGRREPAARCGRDRRLRHPRGMVVSQSVQPSRVPCRSAVTLQVCPDAASVRVLPLQGQDPAAARRTLEGVNLALGTIDRRAPELRRRVGDRSACRRRGPTQRGVDRAGVGADRPRRCRFPTSADSTARRRPGSWAPLDSVSASRGTPGRCHARHDRRAVAGGGTLARPDTLVRVWVAVTLPVEVPSLVGRRDSEARRSVECPAARRDDPDARIVRAARHDRRTAPRRGSR